MKTSIRALVLEDSKIWAELMVKHLEKDDFDVLYTVIASEQDFLDHLQEETYDIILADYNLPQWNAEKALRLLKENKRNIPFIVVTGSVGEEKAVELLKSGIQDLVLKENIFRLSSAVRNAIEEKKLRDNEKTARERLEQSELKFRGILEQSELAILGFDADGTILFWNQRCENIFGGKAEQMLGKKIESIKLPEEREKVAARINQIFQGVNVAAEDWFRMDSEGKTRYFHSSYSGVKDESGKVVLGVSLSLDVTDREMLEQQLLQAQKMEAIGQLSGGIAHDFNNQLTVIIGNLQLALKQLKKDHSVYNLISEAESAAKQCVFTVKGLLTLGRKSREIQKTTIDFHAKLDEFEKFIRHLIPATIHVEVKKNAQRCLIEADSAQIQQVLTNLAVNARDAMPDGGTLFVETQNVYFDEDYARKMPGAKPGQFICVSVTDTGIGIPAEIISKIFDPFFTTKKPGEGTGLGLSSVYGIVKSHEGWVNVYSEPHHGTTFKVYMPISAGIVESHPVQDFNRIRGGNETILVADDEEPIRNLVKSVLEQKGYHVVITKDGEEVIKIFKDLVWLVDLILLDLTMPKFSTDEILNEIKIIQPNARVVISSGYSLNGAKTQDLLTKGVSAFIQKPYNTEELAQVVRSVLDMRMGPATVDRHAA